MWGSLRRSALHAADRIMESKTERKARLRKAAGDAIDRAIETGGDPFELMMEATGEGDNICVPYVQQHPFFSEKRPLFKTWEDRERDRDAAALAAEPGPIVWVRRQFDHHRHAAYRLADVRGWHWSNISGGINHLANRYYLHAYVMCDGMIAGELAHRCIHGPPPHRIKCASPKRATRNSGARSRKSGQRSLLRFTSADDTPGGPSPGRRNRHAFAKAGAKRSAAHCASDPTN
jgi:hypothetical protein